MFAVFASSQNLRSAHRVSSLFSACALSIALCACSLHAQTTAQPAAQATTQNTAQTPAKPVVPHVTTTVIVKDKAPEGYLPDLVTLGTIDGESLREAPLSATSITHDLLVDQGARLLSDVVKNDASIGEDYAPVGYYGDYEIRGFTVDLATGFQINGLTVAGEQDVPLEAIERVEFLKGIAGMESGVTSAGGLVNYVTRRPTLVDAFDFATDHRGTAYSAADFGHFFGAHKQLGARINLGGEHIMSYVNDADGWRAAGAASADWQITPKAIFKGDFDYQHKVQRSVCGYQLLGGTVLPDIHRIYPSTMLGEQDWAKPNTFDTHNSSARFDYALPREWRAFAAASYSHSLIDDNVVYAYGNSVAGPDYFFAPDGTYDIYDYRNPGELRINAQAESMLVGSLKLGAIRNDVALGGVLFLRSFQQPSKSVYDWVGSENIYQPITPLSIESPHDSAGARALNEDNHQSALVLQDRIHLPFHLQLQAGGRYDSLRDHNFGGSTNTDKNIWLPQYSASWNPVQDLTLYGNYSVMLSLGPQAPWWAGGFYMSPFFTRQAEIGAKYAVNSKLLLTAALFHMRAPFFYPKVTDAAGDLSFVSEGRETHNGIEVNAEGKAASWLRFTASAAAIRAISDETGTPAYDNKQILNQPHLRTTFFADASPRVLRGLHLMPGWSYTGRKEATRDDTLSVPAYNLFNLGARYTMDGEQGKISLRVYADNIFDKRYWKDTGASYGDTFVHLGAPTTVRFSAHYTF